MKYVVKNETYDFSKFGFDDVLRMKKADPGGISTFTGNLTAFRERGGKLISYHGRMDDVSPALFFFF